MSIDLVFLVLVIVFASLAYWANDQLNQVPVLKNVVRVAIVVVAVVLVVQSLFGGNTVIHISR